MNKNVRVLIVDDKVDVRKTIKNVLLGFNCTFSEAERGEDALALIKNNNFDVIFLDLKLPDITGIETYKEAKKIRRHLGRVIVLTGFPGTDTALEAGRLGVFDYLTKNPVDRDKIRATFNRALCSAPARATAGTPNDDLAHSRKRKRKGQSESAKVEPKAIRKGRILVLDDKKRWLNTIRTILGSEYDLTLTGTPAQAIKHLKANHYSVVIIDKKLSGSISGLDVLSQMRRVVSDLRAIILTGFPDYDSAVESGRIGALAYVNKSEDNLPMVLRRSVEKIVQQRGKPIMVFLSYEKADREKVTRLYKKLMAKGFIPWMDIKSILPGIKWEPEIRKGIKEADFFVACISPNSLSKRGVIQKEFKQALERQQGLTDHDVYLIPARLVDCRVPEPFNEFHYVDLFKKDGFAKLVQVLLTKDSRH